jgi:hypothetical protein
MADVTNRKIIKTNAQIGKHTHACFLLEVNIVVTTLETITEPQNDDDSVVFAIYSLMDELSCKQSMKR